MPWARHFPHWDTRIPASLTVAAENLTSDYTINCKHTLSWPPPQRVKPVPLQVIHHAVNFATDIPHHNLLQLLRCSLGFFFLLCPGEYALTDNPDATPFCLCDVHLIQNTFWLDPLLCTEQQRDAATFVTLEFTTQKNGVRSKLVGLGHSGHDALCPVQAMITRVKHLWLHRTAPDTPIHSFKENGNKLQPTY
jgi:hypothetical protein